MTTFELAVQLHREGNLAEAEELYQVALRENPRNAEALYLLGALALGSGRNHAAVPLLERARSLSSKSAVIHSNLGVAYRRVGRLADALSAFERALVLQPDLGETELNIGLLRLDQGELDAAIAAFERGAARDPASGKLQFWLGRSYLERGEAERAIAHYRRAVALDPTDVTAHANLVYALPFWTEDQRVALEEARAWSVRHAVVPPGEAFAHAGDRSPDRRLRIGYVSPNFRDHCQAFFTVPILENHDRSRFETYCYSTTRRPDAVTDRIRALAGTWRDVASLDADALAKRVRKDGIDVLVDLTMHMSEQHIALFARKPAPVQFCHLAYPGTTGLDAVDCRITDRHLDPPDADLSAFYSERSMFLETFWCYAPLAEGPDVGPLPASSEGRVTFGCFNNFAKTNPGTFALWARVLRAVPAARLLVLAPPGVARARTREALSAGGVAAERVEFVSRTDRASYLLHYHRVDVCLETVPYNGHTTSLDALYMGVPVPTLVGPTVVGRAGASLATSLGLPELVARTPDEYVDLCVTLTSDLGRLAELRRGLRERMRASPLMDAPRFTSKLEGAYCAAWERYCASSA